MKHGLDTVFAVLLIIGAVLLGKMVSHGFQGLASVALIGFIVVSISVFNVKFALCLFIMSMMLSPEIALAHVPDRAVVVRFDDLILILVFIVWLAKSAINKKLPLIKATPLNRYIFYYLAACFLFTGMGIVRGDVSFVKAAFYLLKYSEYFILFWMVYNIIENKNDIKLFLVFLMLTTTAVMIYGYTLMDTIVAAPFDDEPASFGGYMIQVMSIVLGIMIYNRSKMIRVTGALYFLASIPLIIKAQSRSTYLSLGLMCLAIVILTNKYRKRLIAIGVVTVILAPVIIPGDLYGTLLRRIKYTFSGDYGMFNFESSAAARLSTWHNEITHYFPRKPFTGWGITGRGFIDSQYVRTLLELGLIGFFFFALLFYKIYSVLLDLYKKTDMGWEKGLILGMLCGYIGLLIHAVTTNTFIIVRIMEPFWFFLAVILALSRLKPVGGDVVLLKKGM